MVDIEMVVERLIGEHQKVCEELMYYAKTPISKNNRKSFIDALKHLGFYNSAFVLREFMESHGVFFYIFEKNGAWAYKVYTDEEVKLSGGFDMAKDAEYNALIPAFELITNKLKNKNYVS